MKAGLFPFVEGLLTGLGLLVAIGPQSTFVLKQGILKKHIFVVPLFCFLSDVFLIFVGVGGFGSFLSKSEMLLTITRWGGALVLFVYGAFSLRSSFFSTPTQIKLTSAEVTNSLKRTMLILAALTFLNPLVYLDTMVLLGSLSSQFKGLERVIFAQGAMVAAFVWFFSLSYGASIFSPLLQSPGARRVIEVITGGVMWTAAVFVIYS